MEIPHCVTESVGSETTELNAGSPDDNDITAMPDLPVVNSLPDTGAISFTKMSCTPFST